MRLDKRLLPQCHEPNDSELEAAGLTPEGAYVPPTLSLRHLKIPDLNFLQESLRILQPKTKIITQMIIQKNKTLKSTQYQIKALSALLYVRYSVYKENTGSGQPIIIFRRYCHHIIQIYISDAINYLYVHLQLLQQ